MTDFRNLIQRLTDELDAAASNLYFDDYAPDIKSALADARAYLAQPEPLGPTDEELMQLLFDDYRGVIEFVCDVEEEAHVMADSHVKFARAVLARWGRPAIKSVPVTSDAAFAIGQTGGQPSEAERLAFEAWMRGHSWLVAGKWNGTTYVDPQERHSSFNVPAMQTRMLWTAWRDRAALAQPDPQEPTDEELDELFTEIDQSGESESWRSFARAVLARWGNR